MPVTDIRNLAGTGETELFRNAAYDYDRRLQVLGTPLGVAVFLVLGAYALLRGEPAWLAAFVWLLALGIGAFAWFVIPSIFREWRDVAVGSEGLRLMRPSRKGTVHVSVPWADVSDLAISHGEQRVRLTCRVSSPAPESVRLVLPLEAYEPIMKRVTALGVSRLDRA